MVRSISSPPGLLADHSILIVYPFCSRSQSLHNLMSEKTGNERYALAQQRSTVPWQGRLPGSPLKTLNVYFIDERNYEKVRKVTDDEFQKIAIEPDPFHGEWNYKIVPQLQQAVSLQSLSCEWMPSGYIRPRIASHRPDSASNLPPALKARI
jgi:hypothetical protein